MINPEQIGDSDMKAITVLLAEDHEIVRQGLRKLLAEEKDFEVVGEAGNGRLAVELTKKLRPAVVVMDIAMPELNGLEAARQILKALPSTKVLILSAHSDDAYIQRVNEVGAAGYLIKQSSSEMLAEAIREVQRGNTFYGPSIVNRLRPIPTAPRNKSEKEVARLTSREVEVLQRVAEGEPNKTIAADLGISIKTVEKHRQTLMDKLRIHDTAGLTRYAIGAGIIESSVQLTIT